MSYGDGDSSFQAAGGESGLRRLVDDFYDVMCREPAAASIRAMHPDDLEISRDKLARFLCAWLGGPNRYREVYGAISIPGAHQHLRVDAAARDAWLLCMEIAIAAQPYADDFKEYLLTQLAVPAERVRVVSEQRHAAKQAGSD